MTHTPLGPSFLQDNTQQFLYLLIDCAHFDEDYYLALIANTALTTRSLLTNTVDEAAAFAGPVLVKLSLTHNPQEIAAFLAIEQKQRALIWIESQLTFTELFITLRYFLYAEDENGHQVMCRFYDHQCLPLFLPLFDQNSQFADKVKQIARWAIWQQDKQQYLYFDHESIHQKGA